MREWVIQHKIIDKNGKSIATQSNIYLHLFKLLL